MRDNLKVETAGTGKVAAISLAIAQTLLFDRFELRVAQLTTHPFQVIMIAHE
jgi:hypothetical protein